mmetsp:Transcript_32214/g.81040  ORF Transcript_32214/g.81040 Transcript_32214/m.81040 type:complete len:83 (+) Transcript_32214:666-914(+)
MQTTLAEEEVIEVVETTMAIAVAFHWTQDPAVVPYWTADASSALPGQSAKAVVTAAVASHWTEDLAAVPYWTAGASSALPSQ